MFKSSVPGFYLITMIIFYYCFDQLEDEYSESFQDFVVGWIPKYVNTQFS